MKTAQIDTELVIEVREDQGDSDVVATGYGRAVPYETSTMVGGIEESFARDAFSPDDVIGKPLAYRHGEPVGIITGAENREDGLYIDFQIVNTVQGRDAATLARTGASKGLSVGFQPVKSAWNRAKTAVQHQAAQLLEVSLTHMPAYATAGVGAIREGETMSETMDTTEVVSVDTEAREALAEVREHIASIEARAFTSEPVHPLAQFRTFGDYAKAVLDGAVDPSLDVMQLSRDQSEGFQHSLSRFADDCASRSNCPWAGDGSAVLAGISRLLRDLDDRPLPAPPGRPLVQSEALTAVFYAMYSPQLWSILRSALRDARRGDGRELSELAAFATDRTGPDRYGSNMASAFPAISCWDQSAAPGASGLASAARRWSRGVAVPELARAMAWGNAPCSVWYGHASRAPGPASSTTSAPMVIIGGRHDPATPYAWAQALHRQLPTSVLLTFTGDGHTAYGNGSVCLDSAVDAYLVSGRLPADGTSCS